MIESRIEIENKIIQIGKARMALRDYAIKKADTLIAYRKAKAKAITKLRSGASIEIDGELYAEGSATLIPHLAQGSCWQEKLEADTAEALYKVAITAINALIAELNGWQSIHKYED